jgi:molybdenum cofactor cytidylyltransferase
MATAEFISGVILAAGASVRMGRPKQLLPLGGKPLLRHAVDAALDSCLDEVVLVLGHRAREIEEALALSSGSGVRVVVNPDHASGQASSLLLGVRSTSALARAAAILLGDQPGVSAALIDRVVADFRASDALAARPEYRAAGGGSVPGHPVLLARRLWSELECLRGDEGARGVLASRSEGVIVVAVAGELPPDIDTPDDYQRMLGQRMPGRADSP